MDGKNVGDTFLTTYKCHRCGREMELIEDAKSVFFGCGRCLQYITTTTRRAREFMMHHGFPALLHKLYMAYLTEFRE